MPLIIVCGVPLCGKTRRTAEIISKLESVMSDHPWTGINLVNDENSGVAYSDYGDFNKEKEARGKIRSQAEKYVDADSITIIDSPNYIKGFRYELWCVARAAGTNCCCVVPVGNYNECRQRNKERSDGETYTEQQLDELITRWEEPDKNRRWESPLLPVLDEEEIDVDVLISAISGKARAPTRATQNPPLKSTDFLQETDQKVKAIIRQIQEAQKQSGSDGGVNIKTAEGEEISLSTYLSPVQLSRLRQQFNTYLRQMPTAKNSNQAVKIFLSFVTDAGQ